MSRVGSRKFRVGFAHMKPSWDFGSTFFQHFLICKLWVSWYYVTWCMVRTIVLLSLSHQASRSCALERRCCVAADGLRNERGRANVHSKRGFSHHEGTHPLQNHGSVEQNTRMTNMFSFDIKVPQKTTRSLYVFFYISHQVIVRFSWKAIGSSSPCEALVIAAVQVPWKEPMAEECRPQHFDREGDARFFIAPFFSGSRLWRCPWFTSILFYMHSLGLSFFLQRDSFNWLFCSWQGTMPFSPNRRTDISGNQVNVV